MKILNVISSPRQEESFSIKLANGIIEKLQAANPNAQVVTRNLASNPFPQLEEASLQSIRTPAEEHSPEQQQAAKNSDEVIAELKAADVIIIGAPMYNFSIPSTLKAWIDHLARKGMTFRYTENGPEGLVKGKKVYVAMASGGVYSEGSDGDFVAPYLKYVMGFMGMTDVTVLRAEGVGMPGKADGAVAKALEGFEA